MIVYDITDIESFNNLSVWMQEIEKHASKGVYKILVGNKCDQEDKRQVTYDMGKEFADTHGMKFMETSAKSSFNVGESFVSMTNDILKQQQEREIKPKEQSKIDISKSKGKDLNKLKCCK